MSALVLRYFECIPLNDLYLPKTKNYFYGFKPRGSGIEKASTNK